MKINFMKYIFVIFVILLIGLAVYFIYDDISVQMIDIDNKTKSMIIYSDLSIGITGYDTLNPILSKSKDVQYITKLVYDSLTTITKDFKIENNLAEECSKIIPTVYLIKLREDKTWHNGELFTSKDVKFTIDQLKSLELDSIYKQNVENISNVEIIDDFTIKIYLTEETPFFEYMLSFPILSVNAYNQEDLTNKTILPVGTGDYRISSINEANIELERRNMSVKVKSKNINIKIYDTPTELYNAFAKEEIHLINSNNINYETYFGTIGINEEIVQGREFDYLVINNKDKVLSNIEVRRAISHAIDKKKIVYNIYKNKYFTSNFPIDYGSYLYNKEQDKDWYDIAKSKQFLTSNGWEYRNDSWRKENNSLSFDLVVNENHETRILVAENIKEQLEEVGINIKIIKVNDRLFQTYLERKNYELILTGNFSSICPDVSNFFGENNLSNYYNEEVIMLLKEIPNIQNTEVLKEKYKRLIEIYNNEMPFISLYFNSNIILFNQGLKGDMEHNWYNLFYNIGKWYRTD